MTLAQQGRVAHVITAHYSVRGTYGRLLPEGRSTSLPRDARQHLAPAPSSPHRVVLGNTTPNAQGGGAPAVLVRLSRDPLAPISCFTIRPRRITRGRGSASSTSNIWSSDAWRTLPRLDPHGSTGACATWPVRCSLKVFQSDGVTPARARGFPHRLPRSSISLRPTCQLTLTLLTAAPDHPKSASVITTGRTRRQAEWRQLTNIAGRSHVVQFRQQRLDCQHSHAR